LTAVCKSSRLSTSVPSRSKMMVGFKNVFPRTANLNLVVLAGSAGKTFAAHA
jgi:hypothetical protein